MELKVLEKTPFSLRLLVKGISLHTLNSIRRIILSEVPTMAIDYVIFIENSSVFYDEYISHRLGLIPLKSDIAYDKYKPPEECIEIGETQQYPPDCFAKFDLEVEGPEEGIRVVYSGDLVASDPDVVPVYNNIPLFKLIKGQKVKFEAYARLGRGKEHAKWSPVSIAVHKYVPNILINEQECTGCGKCVDACPKNILELTNGKARVKNQVLYECTMCKLCEKVCEVRAIKVSHVENEYILYLEFTGALSPKKTLIEASNILIKKLDDFEEKLKSMGVLQ